MRSWLVKRRWFVGGGVAVLAIVVIVAVALWPSSGSPGPYRPPSRTRVYNATTVCLLTGPQGVAGTGAATVWAGVQKAAGAANDQAQFLAATGSVETVGSVTPFVNTLIEQQCNLVVAVGAVEVTAVQSVAAQTAQTRFLAVGGGSSAANVQVVTDLSSDSVATAVAAELKGE